MNQVDLVVLAFICFGGWIGALRGTVKSFIGFSGSMVGIGLAMLYSAHFAPFWQRLISNFSDHLIVRLPWAAPAAGGSLWQQSAYVWLDELFWPEHLKAIIGSSWAQLAAGSVQDWSEIVQGLLIRCLGNICAFLTVMVVAKAVVSLLANLSLKLAFEPSGKPTVPGFAVGMLQSVLIVVAALAVVIPLLALIEQAGMLGHIQSSFTLNLVRAILERLSLM